MGTTGPVYVSTGALGDDSERARAEREEAMLALKLMLVQQIRSVARTYGLHTPDELDATHGIGPLRRTRRRAAEDALATVELVDVVDTLLWQPSQTGLPTSAEQRAHLSAGLARHRDDGASDRWAPPPRRQLLGRFLFPRMPEGGLAAHVRYWDETWFGKPNLRRWHDGAWVDAEPPTEGPILLLVPGTFVSGTFMRAQLAGTPEGRAFLTAVATRYTGVYTLKHPVLVATPAMNAAALAEWFRGHPLDVDVIAHGSGGAIVRWWRDAFGGAGNGRVRAVLLGAPLAGTALATPASLLSAPSVLTCVAAGLLTRAGDERAAGHDPRRTPTDKAVDRLLRLSLLLLTVRASVASPDLSRVHSEVAAGMLPGWLALGAADDTVDPPRHHTAEAERLARLPVRPDTAYWAVVGDFVRGGDEWSLATRLTAPDRRSGGAPPWAGAALAPPSADGSLVGPSNDLLVECGAMTTVAGEPLAHDRTLRFTPHDPVHHLNYLEHPRTIRFLRACFTLDA